MFPQRAGHYSDECLAVNHYFNLISGGFDMARFRRSGADRPNQPEGSFLLKNKGFWQHRRLLARTHGSARQPLAAVAFDADALVPAGNCSRIVQSLMIAAAAATEIRRCWCQRCRDRGKVRSGAAVPAEHGAGTRRRGCCRPGPHPAFLLHHGLSARSIRRYRPESVLI
jgi:hypothetical protein